MGSGDMQHVEKKKMYVEKKKREINIGYFQRRNTCYVASYSSLLSSRHLQRRD